MASTPAWPRVLTPSLRRIAETWWSTVFVGEEEPLGDLRVAEALGDEREHLELPRGEAGRVRSRRRARPPRQPARPALAQPASDDRRRRLRAEPLSSSSAPAGAPRRRPRRRARAPPRTGSPAAPTLGGAARNRRASSSGEGLGRARRRSARGRPARRRQQASSPVTQAPAGGSQARGRTPSRRGRLVPALQPRGLRPRRGGRPDALQLARRLGERQRLVERRPDLADPRAVPEPGRATPSAYTRGTGQSARVAQDERRGIAGLLPAPAIELDAGAAGEQEQPPEIEAPLGAVLEPGLQVPLCQGVGSMAKRPPDEVEERAAGVLLEARASARARGSAPASSDPPVVAGEELGARRC